MEQPATVAAVNSHTTQPVESVLTMDKPVDPVCPSSPNLDNESNEPSKENEVLLPHDNNLELVSPSSKEFMPKGDMSSKEAYLAGLDSNFGQKPSGVADSPIEVEFDFLLLLHFILHVEDLWLYLWGRLCWL